MKLPPLHKAESEENSGEVNLDYFRGKCLSIKTIAHPRNRVFLSRAIAFLNSAWLMICRKIAWIPQIFRNLTRVKIKAQLRIG
jgi:hypothetical protein